ncbi:hypothetical protein HY612_01530 [Candidatus Roizmanbacteria bacterium]|nr:hypothetical protein [Candidatus Roizmanbacteria bacterium]
MNLAQQELLHPALIKFIVFDIGGVLWEDSDPVLFEAIAKDLGLNFQDVQRAIDEIRDPSTNASISEEESFEIMMKVMHIPKERRKDLERSFNHPKIFKPIRGMQDLIHNLTQNPKINIYLLSDIINISSLYKAVLKAIKKHYPWIKQDHIFISPRIKAAKREEGARAFEILLEKLKITNSSTVVFIDDIKKFVDIARERYQFQSIHFTHDSSQGRSSVDGLRSVFTKAGLL